MASIEQRLQAVEAAINNSRITPELAELVNVLGNELITVWNPATKSQNRYPLSNVFGSGSVDPTNDILPIFEQVPNIDFTQSIEGQIKDYINNSPQFEKTGSQIKWYFVTRLESNSNSPTGFNTIREFYLFTKGKGTYGLSSGNFVGSTDLFLQFKLKDNEGTTQTISLNASNPYDIHLLVNASSAVFLSETATILFEVTVSGQTEKDYYLYVGETGRTVGSGEDVTTAADFVYLNTATPDPVDTSSFITFDQAITEINNAIANITYDNALDINSINAVQNSVIQNEFNRTNSLGLVLSSDITTNAELLTYNYKKIIKIGGTPSITFNTGLPDDFNVIIFATVTNPVTLVEGAGVTFDGVINTTTGTIDITEKTEIVKLAGTEQFLGFN